MLVTISVVSHCQMHLVRDLLSDISDFCSGVDIELILTMNIEESLSFDINDFPFPVRLIRNSLPLGFGANHNQAFRHATGEFFCVLNPDVRLLNDPFNKLLLCFVDTAIAVVVPVVLGADGSVEDSVRHFPSPLKIICKVFGRCRGSDYEISSDAINPDWAAGMFLLFRRCIYEEVGGFDESYFLYYEDVDICGRLSLLGYKIFLSPSVKIVHCAQRSSHRKFKYFLLHFTSMIRFFISKVYWRLVFYKFIKIFN